MALPLGTGIQIVHQNGAPIRRCAPGDPRPGPPAVDGIERVGDFSVAAYPLAATIQSTSDPLFVQYAREHRQPRRDHQPPVAVPGRRRPRRHAARGPGRDRDRGAGDAAVSALTARAREIASTRDPSLRIPEPETDDEVGELARTLDQMLRELDAARSETEQMMQAQREFVADASHELRTPLTSILANLELLQERLDATERRGEEGEMIDSALRSSRRMSHLVSDLLLLARADAGRTGARRECDLAAVAAAALSEVRPVANGHRLTLADHGPVPVDGNPDELHRLTVNLLDNGLRHTPAGTEIRVAVERRNGDAVLEVSDDGPGIPPGMEAQVFSRFVRGAGPADVAGDSGAGLGLAIVKAVADVPRRRRRRRLLAARGRALHGAAAAAEP